MSKNDGKKKFNEELFNITPAGLFLTFIVQIRKWHRDNKKKLYATSGLSVFAFVIIAFSLDAFVPFGAWWNILRTLAMVPLGLSMFILVYGLSLDRHLKLMLNSGGENKVWVPFRNRFSPASRIRISAIIVALGAVIVFAATNTLSFTFSSSVLFALILACLAFVRKTRDEKERAELGVPDGRDLLRRSLVKEAQEEREIKELAKRIRKEEKKNQSTNILKATPKKRED